VKAHVADITTLDPPPDRVVGALTTGEFNEPDSEVNARFRLGRSRYLTAPTVKPAMKRSRNKLYINAMGRLAIRQAAISAPQ
jgi:hypothetical protein